MQDEYHNECSDICPKPLCTGPRKRSRGRAPLAATFVMILTELNSVCMGRYVFGVCLFPHCESAQLDIHGTLAKSEGHCFTSLLCGAFSFHCMDVAENDGNVQTKKKADGDDDSSTSSSSSDGD